MANNTLDFMHDGGAKVFNFCGLTVRNDKKGCKQKENIFRNDGNNVSLFTHLGDNGFYYAKDFGGGVNGYNAITLLAAFAGVDNKEAYKRILKLYNVDTDLDSKEFDNSLLKMVDYMDKKGYNLFEITDLNRPFQPQVLWLVELAFVKKGGIIDNYKINY